ncbi:hypothetical protein IWQ61_005840 [Dispira simplex]|nr:hypothetical protein IWQ61_005840 [Dispira simplex]
MMSQSEYSSPAHSFNMYTAQCQGLTLEDEDMQRAHEINLDVKRQVIHDVLDLVEKVTGVSDIREYSSVTEDIKVLWHSENSDSRH